MARHVCTFAVAHTNISAQPFSNAGRTVRILIPNNLAGQALYAKFSNYYSKRPIWIEHATIALADEAGNLLTESIQTLTVGGDTSFAIVPDRDVFSDRIAFEVQPGPNHCGQSILPCFGEADQRKFCGNICSEKYARRLCRRGQNAQSANSQHFVEKRSDLGYDERRDNTVCTDC